MQKRVRGSILAWVRVGIGQAGQVLRGEEQVGLFNEPAYSQTSE